MEEKKKKQYCLTLNPDVVDEAVENVKETGGKLSPLVETQLKKFNNQWKKKK